MTANQLVTALNAAIAANGGDVGLSFQVTAAHAALDKMSSVSSVIYSGQVVSTYPGPSTSTPAVVSILLP